MRSIPQVVLATVMLIVLSAVDLSGQSSQSSGGHGDLTDSCAACHGSHSSVPSQYGLRHDPTGQVALIAPGATPVSLSCIRCHSTSSIRQAQPEFQAGKANSSMGLFLGSSPHADHAVDGIVRDFTERPTGVLDGSAGNVEALEREWRFEDWGATMPSCPTCHDPHSKLDGQSSPSRQRELCLSCHESVGYAYGLHSTVACSGCHRLHSGHANSLLADVTADAVCLNCHTVSGSSMMRSGSMIRERLLTGINPSALPVDHTAESSEQCLTCHGVHE